MWILQVITETIRVANPVALLWREAQEDVPLKGTPMFSLIPISGRIVKSDIVNLTRPLEAYQAHAHHDHNYYILSKKLTVAL